MAHPWHDVPVDRARVSEALPVVIEIAAGSKNKYELEKHTGMLMLDRVLHSSVHYPANYGFIPRSYCDDGDPLDCLVLGQEPLLPLTIVYVRPIGVMHMRDAGRSDDKVLAVQAYDPVFDQVRELEDAPRHLIREIERFFIDYKVLEEKEVEVRPFEGRRRALEVIAQALDDYDASRERLLP